ncbi:MAG: transposase family protein [Okeania sp. SIO2F4]|uniref:helix-turn-helix domain-containing protein n=1 Tax=Okeania sp. SIO2F4 TaxID=2607790 RepID=UPI00142BE9DC|nr:transposase family protein [Okeania sp. SIO2F4]NES05106.1 transposase family protein [Okeania sp. SIO2F4]
MANLSITDLNSELMAKAIANAKARRNNSVSDLTEEQAAEVLGGFSTIGPVDCKGLICPPFDVASILFDIDPSQAHHWVHRLQPILEVALGEKKVLPEGEINCVQVFIERFPGVERVIMDGTQRPVQRPTDS